MSSKDVVEDFCSSLCDLTVNSKPHINMLTMLAEDYIDHAPAIVQAVEDQLKHVSGDVKLPVLYLIDSIIKNVGESYITLFSKNIVSTFTQAFEKVDEKARSQMYKLRQTWHNVFPPGKLYALDTKVNAIDPAWPITAAPTSGSIHVNPKFLNNPPPSQMPLGISIPTVNQQELLKQKSELLELQKRKVELELLQTKARFEEQKKRAATSASTGKEVTKIPPAVNIITKPKPSPSDTPKPKATAVASHVAPVRIRDPRLRLKESSKEENIPSPEIKSPPRVVLSPVPSPSNSQQSGASTEPSSKVPKKDKKSKKHKEARSSKSKNDDSSPTKSHKESKGEKAQKLTRAEEVLRNLEEEQRLSKIQKLGSDTVINKAKQHEQLLQPKVKEVPVKAASPKSVSQVQPVETKVVEVLQRQNTPDPPPPPQIVSLPSSPLKSSSPKLNESKSSPEIVPDIECLTTSTSSTKEKLSPPEESPKNSQPMARKTPSPPRIGGHKERKKGSKRKRGTSPSLDNSNKVISSPPQDPLELTNSTILSAPITLVDSGQDIDLRLLTSKNMELDSTPPKKAKTETLDDLFGKEDVDLRALPPPAPIISRPSPPRSPSSRSPERQKSWAVLKRSNSEISPDSLKRPYKHTEKRNSDRFNNKNRDILDEEPSFDDPASEERAKERAEMIMKHADEQLHNGNITFVQYNSLLKEVITMNEKRKLQEAMRRDQNAEEFDFDHENSPICEHDELQPDVEPPNVFNKRRKYADHRHSPHNEKDSSIDSLTTPSTDISERNYPARDEHRLKDDRERRFQRERMLRFEHNRNVALPGKGPWINNLPPPPIRGNMRIRDKFGRWPPMSGPGRPFDGKPNFRFGPPIMNNFGGGMIPPDREVPPADPNVLEMIAKDPMKTINIDGVPREIRFYGETAVIMMAWDDPRELNFQPGQRRVTFNDRETYPLQFNAPHREIYVDGMPCKIRLGAPTRELFIDGMFYEGVFGGPPIQVRIGNLMHTVRLNGPLPNVRIGNESRKDLVAGKVTLIVDGKDIFPIYLDAKPQRFDIGGVPYILRFVEALQTVVINGVPFKIVFGSDLPVPMYFHGEKHYLRFSALPKGIRQGYLTIINMEGGRLPSPPPLLPPPPPMMIANDQSLLNVGPPLPTDVALPSDRPVQPPENTHTNNESSLSQPQAEQQPLELLASLMPTVFNSGIGQSYTVEENSNHPPETTAVSSTTVPTTSTSDLGSINVSELLKKLVAVGIVPASDKKEVPKEQVNTEIVPVSFDRPESLKTRQPGLVHVLYSGMQCSSCGVRFPPEQTGKYSQHLDWHFRQNRRERDAMRIAQSRRWNYDVSDWIQFLEIEEKEDRAQSWFEIQEKRTFETEETTEDEPSVPAGEKGENACCDICQDRFDQFYNEEKEEWHLRRAIEVDEKLYHPLCHKDREEKLLNSSAPPAEQDKSILLVPGVEPETIEIPDDAVASEAAVLGMPIDDTDKVETIDLDSEPSNSKDGASQDDMEKIDEDVDNDGHESDDDILHIEVLENKIETFELSDEEDKNRGDDDDNEDDDDEMPKKPEAPSEEELVEIDLSRVKSEKVEIVDLDAQTSQPLVVSTIDGNVELEGAAPVALPKNIIINIPSAITKPSKTSIEPDEAEEEEPMPIDTSPVIHSSEPPPPGEELYPLNVKQRISDADLSVLSPVNKGSELSALCSIM